MNENDEHWAKLRLKNIFSHSKGLLRLDFFSSLVKKAEIANKIAIKINNLSE